LAANQGLETAEHFPQKGAYVEPSQKWTSVRPLFRTHSPTGTRNHAPSREDDEEQEDTQEQEKEDMHMASKLDAPGFKVGCTWLQSCRVDGAFECCDWWGGAG